ncbi:hypothetical protein TH25_12350 [Thalassospira profundimaris]|uniref:Uncharacterized protein n=1 Tax=Thalassospira profundimaris TaxID=502049 RepID=A0A367XC75_9PROT|nr:hypothetical protein [Thalassospira profundimaris]RCK50371.1 hypothetical protein TH25_12350 [Thalassospira profundimaris]
MTPHPPHIRSHSFKGAAIACKVMGEHAFFLHGPVNAGQVMGAQWFADMLTELRADYPDARILGVLDCRNHTGQALMALECGIDHVLVGTVPIAAFSALQSIASQNGCHIWRDIGPSPDTESSAEMLPAASLFDMKDHYLPASECKKRLLAHLAQQ